MRKQFGLDYFRNTTFIFYDVEVMDKWLEVLTPGGRGMLRSLSIERGAGDRKMDHRDITAVDALIDDYGLGNTTEDDRPPLLLDLEVTDHRLVITLF
ncbi:uncharacterized protein LTR77_008949 [Saxophila tyrrhenica]|uniref:Uncharacterized protein n=1 Tax=Saxophila tyrrhenica TaxID=1690608 RepID=A0AAV9P017_9PEZI|nr:hypothetical protein LTR77_008949 [Saxophila tyrrhenica]